MEENLKNHDGLCPRGRERGSIGGCARRERNLNWTSYLIILIVIPSKDDVFKVNGDSAGFPVLDDVHSA